MLHAHRRTAPKGQLAVLTILGSVLAVLGILVLLIELCAFDPGFYVKEYRSHETAAYVGVTEEDLDTATQVLLDYLKDDRSDLDFVLDHEDGQRQYYNDREKLHMADVKDLNLAAEAFTWCGIAAGVALILLAFYFSPHGWRIWKTIFFSILGILAAFALLATFAASDFTSFWVSFHHVFFRNDLWTFDPRTSLLIRMFEESFFFDLVAKILVWFLSICAALLVVSRVLWTRGRNGEIR